jgi:hypothetical protein
VERGSSSCLTMGGLRVERAVDAAVLAARHPAGSSAAWEALEQVGAPQALQRQARALALEQARDDVPRASRQEDLAAPANRLVAGAWAHRWNEARQRVQDAEAHLAALEQSHVPLREAQSQP